MKHHPFIALALSVAIAAPILGPVPVAAAAGSAPTAAATLLRTVRVKVDRDKSLDTVKLFSLSQTSYRLEVTTSKATSCVDFTSDVDNQGDDLQDVWYGTASLDGANGAEIIVRRFDAQDREDGEESTRLGVFTWRAGKLVAEKAPTAALTTTWQINRSDAWRGYHFSNRSHHRYVDALTTPANSTWTTAIRSIWSHGHWTKLSKRKLRLSDAKAEAWSEFSGTTILRSQFRSDLDGDGAADAFTYRSTDSTHYVTSIVTAKGKKLSKTIASDQGSPLLGAAHFDGVAGTELAFIVDGEDPEWKVFTWRDSKLVAAMPPSFTGEKPREVWSDGDTDDTDSLVFSLVSDVATVESISAYSDSNDPPCYFVVTSQWRAGAWVKTAESDPCLTSVTPAFTGGIVADLIN